MSDLDDELSMPPSMALFCKWDREAVNCPVFDVFAAAVWMAVTAARELDMTKLDLQKAMIKLWDNPALNIREVQRRLNEVH